MTDEYTEHHLHTTVALQEQVSKACGLEYSPRVDELTLIVSPRRRGDLHVGQQLSLLGSDWLVQSIMTTSPERCVARITRLGETP